MMDVSLVLCTKNGGDRLKTCLSHIEDLRAPKSMQVILVDNGSTDNVSFGLLKEFSTRTRFQCEVTQTFVPGNSAGRNEAIALATGEILVFIDDDCYVAPSLITEWVNVFADTSIGFATG